MMRQRDAVRVRKQIKALPSEWWKGLRACHSFSKLFARHLLGLHVVFKHRGKIFQDLYSGFALYYSKRLMWVTAGHVIDEISERGSDPEYQICTLAWLDGCDIPGAESIPAGTLDDIVRFSATQMGLDIGIASLDNAAMTLKMSPRLQFLTEEIWRNHEASTPEGYYLAGFPAEWWKTSISQISPREAFAQIQAAIACIPLERIKREDPVCSGDFWDHPTAFYAKVIGAPNVENLPVPHLRGTSGGPIFSIERTSEGRMKYRLFGVQSSCLDERPILRAESMCDLLSIMSVGTDHA